MAVKDFANNKNYLTYRLGTSSDASIPYNEIDTANYPTFNATSPISSEIEKSIKLNNTTSTTKNIAYVNYMNNIPMEISATASFTTEMWIKPENVTAKQYLISRENFVTPVAAGTWRLYLDTDGKIKFEIFPTAAGAALAITPSGTQGALTINTWNHIAAVFSRNGSNNQVAIYQNGSIYATYSWLVTSAPISALEVKTIIGGRGLDTSNSFIGSISNVAI